MGGFRQKKRHTGVGDKKIGCISEVDEKKTFDGDKGMSLCVFYTSLIYCRHGAVARCSRRVQRGFLLRFWGRLSEDMLVNTVFLDDYCVCEAVRKLFRR